MLRFWSTVVLIGSYYAVTPLAGQCVDTWKCARASSAIMLDADLSEWESVEGITTELFMITQSVYKDGNATFKCLYDDDNIYLTMQIPGLYRFNAADNHQCAAIATMTKIGEKATYVNMGGCPAAATGCEGGVPESCDAYRVDIGAHWELSKAERLVEHPTGGTIPSGQSGTGNDVTPANKDDEYGVSPECRFDDDGEKANNEWRGSWTHTDPEDGVAGNYIFELSRLLSTTSASTDAQYTPGNVYQIGLAYWDPYETETGWTDSGHYVTGCASGWINLQLGDAAATGNTEGSGPGNSPGTKSRAVESFVRTTMHYIAIGLVVAMAMCM